MTRLYSAIAFSFVLLLPTLPTAFYSGWEAGPWERHDTEDGLVVYLNDEANDDVPAVRVDGVVNAPPQRVFETIIRHDRAKSQDDVVAYTVLESNDEGFRTYQRIDPTGIGPRDFILQGTFIRPKVEGGSYAFRWKSSARGPKPKEGVVRVTEAAGVFALEPAAGGAKTRVSYRSLFDPDVSAPGFILRRALVGDAVARLEALQADLR